MLTLEKKPRSEELRLTFRNKENGFCKNFLMAFGISLGLHFLGVLLFSIGGFALRGSSSIHQPIEVLSDKPSNLSESLVYNDIETDRKVRPIIAAPPLPLKNQIHAQKEPIAFAQYVENTKFKDISPQDISWISFDSRPIMDSQLSIHLLGGLENLSWKDESKSMLIRHLKRPVSLSFKVNLDTRSGLILGTSLDKSSGDSNLDSMIEKWLFGLQFTKNPKGFIRTGWIEIVYLQPEKNYV